MLDEAAQIEDSKLFIVLARCPSLKKIILVGDPKQLQPYVPDSLRNQGYGRSTMERMMDSASDSSSATAATGSDAKAPYVMLEEQFRMAPPLRQVVSHLYYNGRLQDGAVVRNRGPVEGVKLQPLLVINLTGASKSFNTLHQSYENKGEAMIVNVVCEFLFSSEKHGTLPEDTGELTTKDMCILTPFNQHKDRLRMLVCNIEEKDLDQYSGQTYGSASLGSPTKSQAMYGTQEEVPSDWAAMAENIDTVDKFQGSERKVVIISTCVDRKPLRAADPHFINVACSRAQHLLIIVGNFSCGLATSRDWSYVHNQAKEQGSYVEHRITETRSKEDEEVSIDIHEDELKSKLQDVLERPSQKRK